jgi:glycosyltransferase involved in cell wall biosynthesis
MMAFNHEAVIAEAVTAALAQDYSPLEIIISDDGSSDGTFAAIERVVDAYRGPHLVKTRRAPTNAGVMDNLNYLIREARGAFIVYADGDDVSRPDRTATLVRRWRAAGGGDALLFSDFEAIDARSRPVPDFGESACVKAPDISAMARGSIHILCATCAMSRTLFDRFPPMLPSVTHVDRVLPFRARLLGGRLEYVDEKLVRYRVVGGISRDRPGAARDYLFRAGRAGAARMRHDARQRLEDARSLRPVDASILTACAATLAGHEAFLDLADAPRGSLEAKTVKWLTRGATPAPLLKLYLKHRFMPAFDAYFGLTKRAKRGPSFVP